MSLFHKFGPNTVKSRDEAVRFMKSTMPDLCRRACEEGWQTGLLDFVQRRQCRPTGEQIGSLIENHEKIDGLIAQMDEATRAKWNVPTIAERRNRLKEELLAPLELKATG